LYSSFFTFDGPPTTGFELNGWGDDLVHEYLRGIEIDGRLYGHSQVLKLIAYLRDRHGFTVIVSA
jgi:hypothetical protein